jgi:hypothetical protein
MATLLPWMGLLRSLRRSASRLTIIRKIRITAVAERRRHTNEEAIGFRQSSLIGGGLESLLANERRQGGCVDVPDITLARVEPVDFRAIDVESHAPEAGRYKGAN